MNTIRYWICGDLHGSHLPIENFWRRNKDKFNFSPETDCIILLGDAGLNYYDYGNGKGDRKVKRKLSKLPFTYFCIRGNHEPRAQVCCDRDPDSWSFLPTAALFNGPVYKQSLYPHIYYALDTPEVYNIAGLNTLVIPGAYSVDKYHRLANQWNWFSDEQLAEYEREEGLAICREYNWTFDLILSHTCPIMYEPTDLFLSVVDQSTVDKTMERYLGQIEYNLNYKLWCWGHYHHYRVYPNYEGKQCIMLSDGKEVINLQETLNRLPVYPITY